MQKKNPQSLKALFGTTEPPEQVKALRVGALDVELRGANVGRILYDGVEILRGISYLVRDQNWGTCAAKVSAIKTRRTRDSVTLRYAAVAKNGPSTLRYQAVIKASPDRLEFAVAATPDLDFQTNRTGFVVLHPISGVSGKPVTVTHVDGSVTRARFPKLISPGQPFFNVRALTHRPAPGLAAHVEMQGNTFEMEDQRNWGDASYKTYVCSLLDPWPYVLKAGETFHQAVTLRVSGTVKARPRNTGQSAPDPVWRKVRLPAIGLSISAEDAAATLKHITELKALSPGFLTCLWDESTTANTITTYARIARETALPITLELVLPGREQADIEVGVAAAQMSAAGLAPQRIVVTQALDLKSFQPTDVRPWGPRFEDMAAAARAHFPAAVIGGGMISYFTELNRKRPPQGLFDFVTHSLCPIVHDASDAAVMQTLETLPHIFASAKDILGKSPYQLGPTTIAARMNPYGAAVAENPRNRRVCLAPNDPRQFGEFSVTWNLGLIEAAARAGVQALCLGGLCGPRGLLDGKGSPTPLYKFLAAILAGDGFRIPKVANQDMTALGVATGRKEFAYFGNTAQRTITVKDAQLDFRLQAFRTRRITTR